MNDLTFTIFEVALVPVCMILLGLRFRKTPPKSKNSFLAYKTDRAIRNDDTFAFAHRYFGRLLLIFGIIALVYSTIAMVWAYYQGGRMIDLVAGILCLVNLIPMCITLYPTERALKRCFDDYGNRIDYDEKVD